MELKQVLDKLGDKVSSAGATRFVPTWSGTFFMTDGALVYTDDCQYFGKVLECYGSRPDMFTVKFDSALGVLYSPALWRSGVKQHCGFAAFGYACPTECEARSWIDELLGRVAGGHFVIVGSAFSAYYDVARKHKQQSEQPDGKEMVQA